MKHYTILIVICLFLGACSKNDDGRFGNPNIPNLPFDTGSQININLPQYSQLQFPGNYIVLNEYGLNGIVLYSSGTSYSAFELSDPNHQLNSCSRLTVEAAIATCTCNDGNSFEIVSGNPIQGTVGQYTLVPYGVEVNGNIIRVFNN